jgi:hypothetical protein
MYLDGTPIPESPSERHDRLKGAAAVALRKLFNCRRDIRQWVSRRSAYEELLFEVSQQILSSARLGKTEIWGARCDGLACDLVAPITPDQLMYAYYLDPKQNAFRALPRAMESAPFGESPCEFRECFILAPKAEALIDSLKGLPPSTSTTSAKTPRRGGRPPRAREGITRFVDREVSQGRRFEDITNDEIAAAVDCSEDAVTDWRRWHAKQAMSL